jgi:hypothetical protein
MSQSIDRRIFLGSLGAMAGAGFAVKETGAIAAAGAADVVLDAVVAEMIALEKRVLSNPDSGASREQTLELASMFRLVDVVTTVHDLKRRIRVQPIGADSTAAAEQVARQMRAHGIKMSGDDFLKRHFERRAQVPDPDRLDRAIAEEVASGQFLQDTAAWLDATAAAMASAPNGVTFREGLRGPARDLSLKKVIRLCAGSREAAAMGVIYGWSALGTFEIPQLSLLFGISAAVLDTYAWICG